MVNISLLQIILVFFVLLLNLCYYNFNSGTSTIMLSSWTGTRYKHRRLLCWLEEMSKREVHNLNSIWIDGSILCDAIHSVVPGVCDELRDHKVNPLRHAQDLATHVLRLPPGFSITELQKELSPTLEKRFWRYLLTFKHALLLRAARNSVEEEHIPEFLIADEYVARGMGLITASINERAIFFIYSKDDSSLVDITVEIRGPNGDYGIATSGEDSDSESHSIPVDYRLTPDCLKVCYQPRSLGLHELYLTKYGFHIPGSPFPVNVEESSGIALARYSYKQWFSEEEEERKKREEEEKKKMKVVSRIIDFVSEKMYLTDDGKLIKIEENVRPRSPSPIFNRRGRSGRSVSPRPRQKKCNQIRSKSLTNQKLIQAAECIQTQYNDEKKKSYQNVETQVNENLQLLVFQERCQKIVNTCDFLLNHTSKQKCLEIVKTAENILGIPREKFTVDSTDKIISNKPIGQDRQLHNDIIVQTECSVTQDEEEDDDDDDENSEENQSKLYLLSSKVIKCKTPEINITKVDSEDDLHTSEDTNFMSYANIEHSKNFNLDKQETSYSSSLLQRITNEKIHQINASSKLCLFHEIYANKNEFNDSFNLETNLITDNNDEKSLKLTSMCIKNEEFNDNSSQHNAECARKSFKIEGNSKLSNSSFAIIHSNSTDTETTTNTKIKEVRNNHTDSKIKLEIPNDNQNNGNDYYPEKQLDIEIQNITNKIVSNKETADKKEITYKQIRELNKQYSLQNRKSPLRKGAICKLIEKFENPTKNNVESITDHLKQTKQEKVQDSSNNKDEITIDKNNTFKSIIEKDNAEENKHIAITIKNYEHTLPTRDLTNYNECRREGSENQIENKLVSQNDIQIKNTSMYEASGEKFIQNEITNTTSEEAQDIIISNIILQNNKENDKKCKTSEPSILTLIQDEVMSEDKIKMEKFSEHKNIDEKEKTELEPKTEENVKSNEKEILGDETISKQNEKFPCIDQANISEFNNILIDVKQLQTTEESSDPSLKIIKSHQVNNKDELEKENKVSALEVFSAEMNPIKQEVEQEQLPEENYHKSCETGKITVENIVTQEKIEKLIVTIKSDIEIKLQEQNKTENKVNVIQKISKSTNNEETVAILTEPKELQEKLTKRIDLAESKDKYYEHKSQSSEKKSQSSPSIINASIINNEIKLDEVKSDKGEQTNSKVLSTETIIKASEISPTIIKETEVLHESVNTTDNFSTSKFKKNDQLLPESNFSQHLLDKLTNRPIDKLESPSSKIDELGTETPQTSIQKEAKIKVEEIIQNQTKEPEEEIIDQKNLLNQVQEECYRNVPHKEETCSKTLQQPHTRPELVQPEFQIKESHKPEACMEQSELKLRKEEIEHFHMRTENNTNVNRMTAQSVNQEIKQVEPQTKQDEIKEQEILQGNEKIRFYETIKPKEPQNVNEQKVEIKPLDSYSLMIETETDKDKQTEERELQVNLSEVQKLNQEEERQLNNAEQSVLLETKINKLTITECIQDELHSTVKEVSDDEQANQKKLGIIKAKENVPDKLCKIKQGIDDQEKDSVLLQIMTKPHYKNKTEEKIMFECSNVKANIEKTKSKETELKVPELNLTVNVRVISDTKQCTLNVEETKQDYKQNEICGSKLIDIKVSQEDVHTNKHKEESLNTYEIIQEQSYTTNEINSDILELPKEDIKNQEVIETNMESEFLDVDTIKIEDFNAEVPGLESLDTQTPKMDLVKSNNQIIEENLRNSVELDLEGELSEISRICQMSNSEIINKNRDETKTMQDQELLSKSLLTQDSCLEHSETTKINSVNQEISKEIEKITLLTTKTEFIDQYKKNNEDIKQIQKVNMNTIYKEYSKEIKELKEISSQSNQEELLSNFKEKTLTEDCKDINEELIQPSFKIEIIGQRTQRNTEVSETKDKTEELNKNEEINFKSVTDSLNEKTVKFNLLKSMVENKQGESEDLKLSTKKEDKLRENENKVMTLDLTQTYESEHLKDFDEKIENPVQQTVESTSITVYSTEINIPTNITEELACVEIQNNEVTKSQEYEIIQPISTTECHVEKSEPETEIKSLKDITKEFSTTESINKESILKSMPDIIDKNEMEFDVKTQSNIDLAEIIQAKEMSSMINKQEKFVNDKLRSTESNLTKEDETLQKEEILLISTSESNEKEEKDMEIKLPENKESNLSSILKAESESVQLKIAEFISVTSSKEQKERIYLKETYPSENKQEESATQTKTLLQNEKEINIRETAVIKHAEKLDELHTSKTHAKQNTSDTDVLQAKSMEPLPAEFIENLDEKTHNKEEHLIEENEHRITLIDNKDHITVIQNNKEKYLIINQEEIENNKETDNNGDSMLIQSENIEENKITIQYKNTLNEENNDLKCDEIEDKKCNSFTNEGLKDQVIENTCQLQHFTEVERETMKMEIINPANKLEQLNHLKFEPEMNISEEKNYQSDNEIKQTENISKDEEVIEKVVTTVLSNKLGELNINEINIKCDPLKEIKHEGEKEDTVIMMDYITQKGKEPQILETTKTNYEKLDKNFLTNKIIDHTSTIENTIEDHKERVPTKKEPIIDNLEELTTEEDLTNKIEMHIAVTGSFEKCTGLTEHNYSKPNEGISSDRILTDLQEAKEALSTVKQTNENLREEILVEEASTTKKPKELNITKDDERDILAVAANNEDIQNIILNCSNEHPNEIIDPSSKIEDTVEDHKEKVGTEQGPIIDNLEELTTQEDLTNKIEMHTAGTGSFEKCTGLTEHNYSKPNEGISSDRILTDLQEAKEALSTVKHTNENLREEILVKEASTTKKPKELNITKDDERNISAVAAKLDDIQYIEPVLMLNCLNEHTNDEELKEDNPAPATDKKDVLYAVEEQIIKHSAIDQSEQLSESNMEYELIVKCTIENKEMVQPVNDGISVFKQDSINDLELNNENISKTLIKELSEKNVELCSTTEVNLKKVSCFDDTESTKEFSVRENEVTSLTDCDIENKKEVVERENMQENLSKEYKELNKQLKLIDSKTESSDMIKEIACQRSILDDSMFEETENCSPVYETVFAHDDGQEISITSYIITKNEEIRNESKDITKPVSILEKENNEEDNYEGLYTTLKVSSKTSEKHEEETDILENTLSINVEKQLTIVNKEKDESAIGKQTKDFQVRELKSVSKTENHEEEDTSTEERYFTTMAEDAAIQNKDHFIKQCEDNDLHINIQETTPLAENEVDELNQTITATEELKSIDEINIQIQTKEKVEDIKTSLAIPKETNSKEQELTESIFIKEFPKKDNAEIESSIRIDKKEPYNTTLEDKEDISITENENSTNREFQSTFVTEIQEGNERQTDNAEITSTEISILVIKNEEYISETQTEETETSANKIGISGKTDIKTDLLDSKAEKQEEIFGNAMMKKDVTECQIEAEGEITLFIETTEDSSKNETKSVFTSESIVEINSNTLNEKQELNNTDAVNKGCTLECKTVRDDETSISVKTTECKYSSEQKSVSTESESVSTETESVIKISNRIDKLKEICDTEIAIPVKISECNDSTEKGIELITTSEYNRESDNKKHDDTGADKQQENCEANIVSTEHFQEVRTDVEEITAVIVKTTECKCPSEQPSESGSEFTEVNDIVLDTGNRVDKQEEISISIKTAKCKESSEKATELISITDCTRESDNKYNSIRVGKQEEISEAIIKNKKHVPQSATNAEETTRIFTQKTESKDSSENELVDNSENIEEKDIMRDSSNKVNKHEEICNTEIAIPDKINKNEDSPENTTKSLSIRECTRESLLTNASTEADKQKESSDTEIANVEHTFDISTDVGETTPVSLVSSECKDLSGKAIESISTEECAEEINMIVAGITVHKQEQIYNGEFANKENFLEYTTDVKETSTIHTERSECNVFSGTESIPTSTSNVECKDSYGNATEFLSTLERNSNNYTQDIDTRGDKTEIFVSQIANKEQTEEFNTDIKEETTIPAITTEWEDLADKAVESVSSSESIIISYMTDSSTGADKHKETSISETVSKEEILKFKTDIEETTSISLETTNWKNLSNKTIELGSTPQCITISEVIDENIKGERQEEICEAEVANKQQMSEFKRDVGKEILALVEPTESIMENIEHTSKRETDESHPVLLPDIVSINEEHIDGLQSTKTRPLSKLVEHSTIQISDCNSVEKTEKFKENIAEVTCITQYTKKYEKEIDNNKITVCMIENKNLEIEDKKDTSVTTEIKAFESGLLKDKNLLSHETDNEHSHDKLKPLDGIDMQCDTDTQSIKREAEIMQQEYPSETLAPTVEIKTERFDIENVSISQSKSEEKKIIDLIKMQNEALNLCEISNLEKDVLEENKIEDFQESDSFKKVTENLEVKETKEYSIMDSIELLSEKVEILETNSTKIISEEFDNKVIKNIEINKTTEGLFKPHAETLVTEESVLNLTEIKTAQSISTTESDQKIEAETVEPIVARNATELVKKPCTPICIMTECKEESQEKGYNKMIYAKEVSTNKMDSKIINNINKSENSNNQALEQNILTDMEYEKERSYLNEMKYCSESYLRDMDEVKEIKSSSNEAVDGYYTKVIQLKEANTNLNAPEQPGTDVINKKAVTKPGSENKDLEEQTIFITQIINETHSDNLYLDTNEQSESTEISTKPLKVFEEIESTETESTTNKSELHNELLGCTRSTVMVHETDENEATFFIENKNAKQECIDQLAELTKGTKTKQTLSAQTEKLFIEDVKVKDEIIKINIEANNEEIENRETLVTEQEMEKLQTEETVTKRFKEHNEIYNELIVLTDLETEIDKECNKVEELLLSNEKSGQELIKINDHQELHTGGNELQRFTFKSEQPPETNLSISIISQELHEKLHCDRESSKINNIPEQFEFEIREINYETETLLEEKTVQKSKSTEINGFINEDLTNESIEETDTPLILNETQNSNKEQILTTIKKQLTENTEVPRIINYIENSGEKLSEEYMTENSNIEIKKLDNFPKINMEEVKENCVSVFEKIQKIDKNTEVSDEATDTEQINCKIENKEEKKEMCLKNKSAEVLTEDQNKIMNTINIMDSTQSFIYECTTEDTEQLVGMEVQHELISLEDYKELNEEKVVEQSESLNVEVVKSLLSSVADTNKLSEPVLKIEDDNTEKKEHHITLTESKFLKADENNLKKSATVHLQTDIFKTEINLEKSSTELHYQDHLIINDTKLHKLLIEPETELIEAESHEKSMIAKDNLKEDVLNKVTDKISSPIEDQQLEKQEININNIPEVITNEMEMKDYTNKLIENSVTENEIRNENEINISTVITKIKKPRPIKKLINFFESKPEEQKSTFNFETTSLLPQNKNNDKINNIVTKRKYFENYIEVSNETSRSNVEETETINKITTNNEKIENKDKKKNISLLKEEVVENDLGENIFHLCKYDSNINDSLITNSYTNISSEITQSNVSDESFGSNEHLLLCIGNLKENDQIFDNYEKEIITQVNQNELERVMFVEDEISNNNNESIAENIQTEAQHKRNNETEILHQLEYNDSKLNDITFNENEHEIFTKNYELQLADNATKSIKIIDKILSSDNIKEIADSESDIECVAKDKTEIKSIHASKDEISKSNINLNENIIKTETEDIKEIQILDAILSENECYEISEQLEDLNETNVINIDHISTDDLSQTNLLEIDFNNEYTDHNELINNQDEDINILHTNSNSLSTDKTHFSANINNENLLFNDIVKEGYLMMIKDDFNDKDSEEKSFKDKISISNNVSEIELSSDNKNNIINEIVTDKSNNDDENEILFGINENSKELITNETTSKINHENIEISEISNQLLINRNFNYDLSSEIVAEKQIDEISNDISNYLDNVQNFIQSSEINNEENTENINKDNEELDSDNSSFNIKEKLHEELFSGDFEKYDIKTDESEGNEESYKEIADNILDNKEHGECDNSSIVKDEKCQDFEKYDKKNEESEGNEESYKNTEDNILDNKEHGSSDNSLIVKQERYQEELLFPNNFERYDIKPDESDDSNKENDKETADNVLHYEEHDESSENNNKGYKEIADNVSVIENYQNDLTPTDEIHDELKDFKMITVDTKRNDSLLVQLSTDSDIYLYNNNIRNSELDESFSIIPDCLCESLLSNNEMIENVEEPKGDSFEDNFSQLLSGGGKSTVDINVGFEDNFMDKFTMMNNKDINDINLDDTSNKFHLWSSNIEFGPPSNENILTNEITNEMDFDSIISAPSLNDALEKLEKRIQDKIKKKESINKNSNALNEKETKIQSDDIVDSKMNENELSQPDIQTAEQDKNTIQESNKEDIQNIDEIDLQTNITQTEIVNADNVNAQVKYENEQYPSISYSSCSRGSSRMEMIEEENEDELFTLIHNTNSLKNDEIKLINFDNLAGLHKNKNISASETEDDNTKLNEQKFSEISFVITDTNTTDYLIDTSTSDNAVPEETKCDKEEENTITKITYEENYQDDNGPIKQENEVKKNVEDKDNISSKNSYSNDENSGADKIDSSVLVITSSDSDNFQDEINSEKQNKIILDTDKQELEKDEIFKRSYEKEMKTNQQEMESETDKTKTKNSLVYNKKLYWDKKLELISKSNNNEAEKRLQQKTLQKHKAVDINNDITQNTISTIKQIEQSNDEVQIINYESITQEIMKANNKNDTQLEEVQKSETIDRTIDKLTTENDENNQTNKTVDKWKDYWDNLLIEKEGQQIQQPIKKKTLEKQASIKVCGIVENNRNLFEVPKKYNDYRCTNNDNLNYTIIYNNINIETEHTEDRNFNETLPPNEIIGDDKLKNDITSISGYENDKKLSQNFENNNDKQPNKTDKNSLVLLKKERKVFKCIQIFELKANSLISNDSNLKQNSENTRLKCNILNNECQSNKNTSVTTPTTIKVDYFDDTQTDNECLNKNTKRIESIESSDGEFYNPLTMTPCGRIRSFSTGKIEEIPDSTLPNNENVSTETNDNNKQEKMVDTSSNNKLNNLKEPTTMIRAKSEGNLVSDEHVDIHQRFERAKNFFKELEQSSSCTNIDKISTMKISSSLAASSYHKKQISVDSDSCGEYCKPKRKESKYRRRGRRRKDSMKVRSAPTSDSEIKIKSREKEFGGSERRKSKKVSERFHIKDLFHDISSSTDGIFRGIPNRKAVLASLKSMEDLRSATLDEEEEKEKESNRSQSLSNIPSGYQEEYPYLPTTPPNRFRPRSQFEGSLITRKMLLQLDI